MDRIFVALVVAAFGVAVTRQWAGPSDGSSQLMAELGKAILHDASGAVTLALGLIGAMALFLGVLKVAEAAGVLGFLASMVRPLLRRLFPSVPPAHPAMGAMVMNVAANFMGLGNAATPFGIRAMQHLQMLNAGRTTASDAMVLFLSINTAGVTLLPTSVIALRAAAGSVDPAAIVPTTLFATTVSMVFAVALARWLGRWFPETLGITAMPAALPCDPPMETTINSSIGAERAHVAKGAASPTLPGSSDAALVGTMTSELRKEREEQPPIVDAAPWVRWLALLALILFLIATLAGGASASAYIVPAMVTGLLLLGAVRRVPVYQQFVAGARDGFDVAVRIIPYLVAILVAVGMLRASGALDAVITPVSQITAPLGLPAEALLMALLRTLSGSGAFAYLATLLQDPSIGPDSYTGCLVSTIQASTETTFYVLAVYFGAVGVTRMRHAVIVGVLADAVSAIASVIACQMLLAP